MSSIDIPTFSTKDILLAFKTYEKTNTEDANIATMYFISDLTGLSVDKINELMREE